MRPRPRPLVVVLAVLALGLAACGDDDTTATDDGDPTATTGQEHGCAVAEGGEVTIVAEDLAWDVECLQAPEGVDLEIVVDNRDDEVNHNLHLSDLPGEPATPLEAGPVEQRLPLAADVLVAGEYGYVCDIHPTMTGTLEVLSPLAEGPTTTQG